MKRHEILFAGAIFAIIAISGQLVAQVTSAALTGGRVEGVASGGIGVFKGIPFAAPPVGDKRWKMPQPVVPWTGVKKVDAFAPGCMQQALVGPGTAPGRHSEDCLYLNVWTPAKSASEKLPVMVWIYGGGFALGETSTPMYDGANLAKKGVVLVSVSYRVGPFGFLAHPELSKESGKGSGSYGIGDQIAGLRWVKANIAQFGGDPGNVTIFGESAGGISVSMLAASPAAKGLFQKAISESGGSFAPLKTADESLSTVPTLKTAEAVGQRFFASIGAADLKAARALPADKILAGPGTGMVNGQFWPVADGEIIVGDQYELYSQGKFNDTPILIGTNADEGRLFIALGTPGLGSRGGDPVAAFTQQARAAYGDKADVIIAAYASTPGDAAKASQNLFRDGLFAWPTWSWAGLQASKGKGKVYVYHFENRGPSQPDGATHADEIPYVFGNLDIPLLGPPPVRTGADRTLSEQFMGYWTNFARTGDPNGPGLPVWPAFTAAKPQVMNLAPTKAIDMHPNLRQIKALDDYFAWRRGRVKSDR
jgi:para-nitrobenzyl esterase